MTSSAETDSGSEKDCISFRPYAPFKKRPLPEEVIRASEAAPLDLSKRSTQLPTPPMPTSFLENYPAPPSHLPLLPSALDQWYQNAAALNHWYTQQLFASQLYSSSRLPMTPGRPKLSPSKRPATADEPLQLAKQAKTELKVERSAERAGSKQSSTSANNNETDFLCSCGKNFDSLYIFTLHLKQSGHRSVTYQRDKDIPKLVRGQDMWINSEIEQTREILRCIRCKKSFKSLPDLTMHMVETRHFQEIVYNESRVPENGGLLKPSRPAEKPRTSKTEVKEADSSDSQSLLVKIQNLVETSLGPSKKPGVFQEVLHAFDSEKMSMGEDETSSQSGEVSSSPDVPSYLSPDHVTPAPENPLSSLQKLVETTDNSVTAPSSGLPSASELALKVKEEKSASKSPPHTVIMFNPTYVYQHPLYSYPLCPSLPLFGAGMGSLEEKTPSPKSESEPSRRGDDWSSSEGLQLMQKKAKCNFCSKPFANKGQVRLHISKGKCPSLLRRSGGPFPYMGFLPRPEERFLQLQTLEKMMKEVPSS